LAIFFAFVAIYTVSRHVIDSNKATTSTTTTTTTTATTGATSTTLAGDACKASDFTGTYNEGEGAAGTVYASVTLLKSTPGTCAIKGWPLLTLQDKLGAVLPVSLVDVPSSGSSVQFPSAQANAAPSTVTLSYNEATEFSLAYSDVPSGTAACESAVSLSVQLATQGAAIAVTPTYPVQPCNAGQIWVSPFY
jgi:hypothetical protein